MAPRPADEDSALGSVFCPDKHRSFDLGQHVHRSILLTSRPCNAPPGDTQTALSSDSAPPLGGGSGLGQTGTGAGDSRSHSFRMESSVTPRATSSSRQVAERKSPGRRPPSMESA